MAVSSSPQPRRVVVEMLLCAALVTVVALCAFWRMDYFSPDNAQQVMMTDQSRTAYVAKNVVEGRGYVANDLPAYLLDFYHERGKLDDATWDNADRFPFTAYAIAALYAITGEHTPMMGILVYNLIWFAAFAALLFWFAYRLWGERISGIAAITVALVHPYTYVYLYSKDADMLFITTACMVCFHSYFSRPSREVSRLLYVAFGTMLAWTFLCRPNLGAPLVLFFGGATLVRLWRARREQGLGPALLAALGREGIAFGVAALWLVPFVVHSLGVWGSPFFSANGMYQLPLGTRYAMGTDTWWKYTDPEQTVTLGTLIREAPVQLITKFTSSWPVTFKGLFATWGIELLLACALIAFLRVRSRAVDPAEQEAARPAFLMALAVAAALLFNLLLLPLYGPQATAYRHYLSFGLPLMWLAAGHAIVLGARAFRPHARKAWDRARDHRGALLILIVAGVVIASLMGKPGSASWLFTPAVRILGKFWLVALLLAIALFTKPWRWQRRSAIALVALYAVVLALFRPNIDVKKWSLLFFPDGTEVWDVLREMQGVVSSFGSPQGEIAWMTDRKHVPAPELVMHLYSFLFDHGLEVEDLYINSAEEWLGPENGPWATAAPGFEGYARLQRLGGTLPGYQLVYNEATVKGFPRLDVPPRRKAASVYRLVDRDAVQRLRRSPDVLDVGDPANIVHTAHGFESYVRIDDRNVVAATDVTRRRFTNASGDEKPYETSSVTFFLEPTRTPGAVEIELYVPQRSTLSFYFNLDLYDYTPSDERPGHEVGKVTASGAGWQKVRLLLPPALVRKGLNKIGLRATKFQPIVVCPATAAREACLQMPTSADPIERRTPASILAPQDGVDAGFIRVGAFVSTLTFQYGDAPR
jgi:hypothetical protein